jgi:hypothetical protein
MCYSCQQDICICVTEDWLDSLVNKEMDAVTGYIVVDLLSWTSWNRIALIRSDARHVYSNVKQTGIYNSLPDLKSRVDTAYNKCANLDSITFVIELCNETAKFVEEMSAKSTKRSQ